MEPKLPSFDEVPRPSLPQVGLAGMLASGALFITVGVAAQQFHLAWGIWFSSTFVFLAVPFITLKLSGRNPLRLTGLDQPAAGGLVGGFVTGALNYFAWALPLMWLSEQFFSAETIERYSSAKLFERQTAPEMLVLIGGICLAAPVCEEFLYRGLAQPAFAARTSMSRAIVLTAAIFTFMHFDPVGLLARFELGVVFGLLAWRGGSLWPAIGAHAANNILSVALFFGSGAQDASMPGVSALTSFLGGNVLLAAWLIVLSRRRFWVAPIAAEDAASIPPPFFRVVAPWGLGMMTSIAALVAIDRRGVELNLIDLRNPVERPSQTASDGEKRAWEELQTLRAQVRQGNGSLAEYRSLRQLASEHSKAPKGL